MDVMTTKRAVELLLMFGGNKVLKPDEHKQIAAIIQQLESADKVAKAASLYVKHINSPLCIGWDDLIDALAAWKEASK